jgi:hypothetical protein
MSFKLTLLLVVLGIGAVVGFVRSDSETFIGKIISGFGGAILVAIGLGLLVMFFGGGGGSEGGDISDGRAGS